MKNKIKLTILIISLLTIIITSFLLVNCILAYFDWQNNKDRLINNLTEYYNKLKNYNENNKYIILNDEGKIVEVVPTRIYDRNLKIIGEFSPSKREIIPLSEIPVNLINSLILIEDREFYKHKGINYKGIIRAALTDIIHLKIIAGGSSITQQLAKILFTSRERNIYRKFLEMYGALYIEKKFSKEDILLMYLNTAYFGHGTYGVQAASQLYFQKNVRNLDQFEIGLLISLIPGPNYYNPFSNLALAKKRHLVIMGKLKEYKKISAIDFQKRYEQFWSDYEKKLDTPYISYWKMDINKAPYISEYIRQYLQQRFSVSEILENSLKVNTTIDLDVQFTLNQEIQKYLKEIKSTFEQEEDYKKLEIAAIVMSPDNGDVLAFIGGNNYTFKNQLNRAMNMKRQIGSSIKPLLYGAAIDEKLITLTTIITDKPVKYYVRNQYYIPKNYDLKYQGKVFCRDGLIQSLNTVSVQILNRLTPAVLIDKYLDPLYNGINDAPEFLPVLSLALGTVELSPYQLAIAYSVIANGGHKIYPSIIKTVDNTNFTPIIDNNLIQNEKVLSWSNSRLMRVYSEGTCYIINDTLRDVFSKGGTAQYAIERNPLNIRISGKTGTTSDFKDAWCIGYTKDYVVVIWMGYDDYKKSLGKGKTGGTFVAPLIIRLFNKLYWNEKFEDFKVPTDEITFCNIDGNSGKLAQINTTNILYNIPYLNGTSPIEYNINHP